MPVVTLVWFVDQQFRTISFIVVGVNIIISEIIVCDTEEVQSIMTMWEKTGWTVSGH